ncbi:MULTISPECIES: DUF983 domain-containing protein [unclassified Phenylobacterium]|uniref:DUF983 domain-containing protein n=1 Tax=unclassified Phenylobacterium TaxID=2640670 RepID=UPI00226407F6|nr:MULTISPECIES: DUF983 domain-containing protein [unclassified Phenylobacterium]MBS0488847.1 DUF983 domain-containing protein [Pseudomonadota bacterium]MCX7588281.1 DUF983 domain-containing protein [Phenylobacterium sp. 58.2.17]WGU40964.1 DUF983 domain-containing protein [Phenylobacterium sp. NIBR 498073]
MFVQSMLRGLKGRCPACGEGKLFSRYLKVQPTCSHCGLDLAKYPADDGPAYFTILIVGHLVVAPLLIFPVIWEASPAIVLPATLIPLAIVTLVLLHVTKGWFIGLLYALGVKQGDRAVHTADVADR